LSSKIFEYFPQYTHDLTPIEGVSVLEMWFTFTYMSFSYLKYITYTVHLITLLCCIWFLFQKKSKQPYRLFAIGWLIIECFIFYNIYNISSHGGYLYFVHEFFMMLFSIGYIVVLLRQRKLMVIVVLFALFYLGNLFIWPSAETAVVYPTKYAAVLGGIIIILLSTMKIYRLFKHDRSGNLFGNPDFWVCCGFAWFWLLITPVTAFLGTPGQIFLGQFFLSKFLRNFYSLIATVSIIIQSTCIIKSLQCNLNQK
jgi:hypothetical protein